MKLKNGNKVLSIKLIIIFVIICMVTITMIYLKMKDKFNASIAIEDNTFLLGSEYVEIGDKAVISGINLKSKITGTAPFDSNNNPGNDSSATNDIVRSFDQVRYNIEVTGEMKSGYSSIKGGAIAIKATIPEKYKDDILWNTEDMKWAHNVNCENGILYAEYWMNEGQEAASFKQTLELIVNVIAVPNGEKFKPTFDIWLVGNNENEHKILDENNKLETTVSAAPKYNIQLKNNEILNLVAGGAGTSVDFNDGQGEISGRMYGCHAILQLKGDNPSKGLKGVEVPVGDITFDINLAIKRSGYDITSKVNPKLWNYKINTPEVYEFNRFIENPLYGEIKDRNMYFVPHSGHDTSATGAPNGNAFDKQGNPIDRRIAVYDSGKVKMEQESDSKISVTVKDYKFDFQFPEYNDTVAIGGDPNYTKDIGCFSSLYFQIFVPHNEKEIGNRKNINLVVSDSNFKANTSSKGIITEQTKTDPEDDELSIQHISFPAGKYNHYMYLYNKETGEQLHSNIEAGDATGARGYEFYLRSYISQLYTNDKGTEIKTVNRFVKFDGDGLEPTLMEDGSSFLATPNTMSWKCWYVTKIDGSNWSDEKERNYAWIPGSPYASKRSTSYSKLNLYEKLSDIPKNYVCVGMYFESQGGVLNVPETTDTQFLQIPMRIKDSAEIGKTYGMTQSSNYWIEELDRSKYTVFNKYVNWPTAITDKDEIFNNYNYKKSQYDSSGNIIDGTHSYKYFGGQSIVVLGAEQRIKTETIENNKEKINYDIGNGETEVTFKTTPELVKMKTTPSYEISGVNLKVTVTIPNGVEYIENSCNYKPENIERTYGGPTKLTWILSNCTVGEKIEPIVFKGKLAEYQENGTILECSSTIEEDKTEKIGNINSNGNQRNHTNSINIINLESSRLIKNVEPAVIEKNGQIAYKIKYINITDNDIKNFKLLDILPYDNDSNGSKFSGSYKLNRIEISQRSESGKNVQLNVSTTNSNKARDRTLKNLVGITWRVEEFGKTINKECTAVLLNGKIHKKSQVEITIYIDTDGNKSNDIYRNKASAETSSTTAEMVTNIVETKVKGEKPNTTVKVNVTNKKTQLKIYKQDGTYKKDLDINSDLYLAGAEVKIYGKDLKNNSTSQGWIRQVKQNEGYKIEYGAYSDATTFKTDSSGKIEIDGILYGDYYIYETKTPSGYDIESQPGYLQKSLGSSEIRDKDWAFIGNQKVEEQNNNAQLTTYNYRYVSLSGKVWIDRPDTKDNNNNYDNVYKNGSNDILLQGVTVNLIDNRTNKVIATTNASGTNENGEYKFTQKTDGSKLTYWELAYCYVEFTYDDRAYTLATPFVGSDVEINSKSQIEEVKTDDLRDENLTGNGKAITYKGPTSGLFLNNIQTNASSDVSQRLLTGFYNTSNYTIENINLGLIEKVNTEYSIHEEIEYVKIVRGNYTFTYKYGDEAVIDEQSEETQTAIAFQTSSKKYTQKIYPSDIKYNFAKESDDPKYQVYVLYKISVINNTTHNLIDIYKEDALHLSTLTNQFDDSIYKLNTDELEHEAENNPRNEEIKKINSEIKRWSSDSNSTTANYNINNSNFEKGIAPNAIESTYIQFEVTENGLTNLIKSKSKDAPTVASADGYHGYIRKDKNWKNNDEYKHWTGTQHVKAGGLSIIWKLADERRISGTVFEDKKVNQLEGEEENTRENERIGNGHFEEDNEKTVSDIIVTLMDADKNQVAKLYNGELTEENGKWKAIRHDAVTKVDKEGTYSLPGMIPGRYYLKFTYGNGKIEYTDLNGNKIEEIKTKINGESNPINSNLYKSTILTGNAKKASENEKSWFIDDIGKNNSVATDKTEIITKRKQESNKNVELNYSTSQQNAIIDAESPIMDVQFEYVKNPEIAHNEAGKLNSNCTGMSFGIIERPHINIELTKTIKNVKLTLQNGTTIINGNPEDKNVASNLSKIDDANVKLELDVSYLYGSTAEVTYSLSAQNKSELDYPTEQYYKYGLIEGSEPVKTKVTKVVDYISNSNVGYDKQSNNVEIINLDSIDENMYFSEEAINGNKAYKRSILEMKDDDWLMPEAADPEHSSTGEYTLTVNNLLSTSDGILGWENYSEIIGISNITLTPQYICHSGNYIARDKATSEADNADATISIYSSTGENKNLIIYFMVGTGLLVTLVGILIIKKFVI